MYKGTLAGQSGSVFEASAWHASAVKAYKHLVQENGQAGLAPQWAEAHAAEGATLAKQGSLHSSLEAYDQAIAIAQPLVEIEGRWNLAPMLADYYEEQVAIAFALGEYEQARRLCDQALRIRYHLQQRRMQTESAFKTQFTAFMLLAEQTDITYQLDPDKGLHISGPAVQVARAAWQAATSKLGLQGGVAVPLLQDVIPDALHSLIRKDSEGDTEDLGKRVLALRSAADAWRSRLSENSYERLRTLPLAALNGIVSEIQRDAAARNIPIYEVSNTLRFVSYIAQFYKYARIVQPH
jgi:tetratricopeptide (TPR) repeat protein